MDAVETVVSECDCSKARKRCKGETKREKAKRARYTSTSLPVYPKCGHAGRPFQPFQCTSLLSMADIKEFHAAFYKNVEKRGQDMFILQHCEAKNPKRHRKRTDIGNRPKSCILRYKVKRRDGLNVAVCRQTFQDILGIKKDRILNIVKKYKNESLIPVEKRGGDRVGHKNDDKKQAIKQFVESLKCMESHYCRSKTFNRVYMPAELSIKKLWEMYNAQMINNEKLMVKQCFFRDYFNKHFNVGFGTPKTDLCSTCLQFKLSLKKNLTDTEKADLLAQQKIHKIRANAFYKMLQDEQDHLVTFSFDCQKNLALPKLPDQSAYFNMQINFYHLAIVCGSSKSPLTARNIKSYVWTELDHQRSSNEISSALHHSLSNFNFGETVKIVRLVCDGCGAQNKNSTLIGMLNYWIQFEAPPHVEKVEIIFPVVGHSYIPPDRVFGQIEKIYKRHTEVVHPDEYVNMITKFATVYKIGTDVVVKDWRKETQKIVKQPGNWHFKFQPSKRIVIVKGSKGTPLVSGEAFYRNELCTPKSLCKRGKNFSQMNPEVVQAGLPINKDKKQSIAKLLQKHYRQQWEKEQSLTYFREAFHNIVGAEEEQDEEEENCIEENVDFAI